MREHVVTWYESDDGKIFQDEMECVEYELNNLYHNSGVTFYCGRKKIKNIITKDDKTYVDLSAIRINREKAAENEAFRKYLYYNYGWCMVDEALEGDGTYYKFVEDERHFGAELVKVK